MSYTDEELLDALREFHDKHGRSPTATEANDDDTLPHEATFRRRFGSWNAVVEKAGLTPRKPTFSDEELLDAPFVFG